MMAELAKLFEEIRLSALELDKAMKEAERVEKPPQERDKPGEEEEKEQC